MMLIANFVKQTKLKQAIVDLLPMKFVQCDEKDASSCVIKATAVDCAVLP